MHHSLGALKQQTYFLTALEARSLKSRCQQGQAPSRRAREEPFLASSSCWWLLAILDVPLLIGAPLQFLSPSSHGLIFVCLCLNFPLIIRTLVFGLEPTLIHHDLVLSWLHLQRSCFQIRSHSWVLGLRTRAYHAGRLNSTHNSE